MSTSEDLVNRLFINPIDSIGRRLHRTRRRHTSDTLTIKQLARTASFQLPTQEELVPRSYHASVDYGESIPVEMTDIEVMDMFDLLS